MRLAREYMHLKGLAEYARPGLYIDQRVVHRSAARDAGHVSTQIHALMGRIPGWNSHLLSGCRKWVGGRRILRDSNARYQR